MKGANMSRCYVGLPMPFYFLVITIPQFQTLCYCRSRPKRLSKPIPLDAIHTYIDKMCLESPPQHHGSMFLLLTNLKAANEFMETLSHLLRTTPNSTLAVLSCLNLLQTIQAYHTSKENNQLPPHVYSKCRDILRSMHYSSKSQCCVLTGDSASGKTECLKHILQYIVSVITPTRPGLKSKFLQVLFVCNALI